MKPTLAFQNPFPPQPALAASGRTAQGVRLVAVSGRGASRAIDSRFVATPGRGRRADDERWPGAARLLLMLTLSLASWAAILGSLAALVR